MRKIIKIGAVIAFLILLIYLYSAFFSSDKDSESKRVVGKDINQVENRVDVGNDKKSGKNDVDNISPLDTDRIDELAKEYGADPKRLRFMFKQFEKAKQPIEFYGALVDQYGNSVSKAKIIYSISVVSGFSGALRKTVESDSNGRFLISNIVGEYILINAIEKDGYKFSTLGSEHNNFRHVSDDKARMFSTYSKDNRYTYRGWKHAEKSKAYTNSGKVNLVPDGRTYSLSLKDSDVEIVEGVQDGSHLQVKIKRPLDAKRNSRASWEIYIEPVNGGIIQTNDQYLYLAPQVGYTSSWEQKYYEGSKEYKSHMQETNFYLKLDNNSSIFGRVTIEARPFRRDGSRLYLSYTINPTSSRNLEVQ